MGNNIQIFGRTFSDVSSITVNNTSSSAVKYVQEPIFEDITIRQDYLVKQNTVISNGIIFQTDETYPGTPVVLNNTTVANIDNGDLGQNGIGIKIELNRTYHCTGELKIEWSTGEQEIYSIDSDFTPTNYDGVSYLSFSWEGIGTSTQTFNFMYLNFVNSSYSGYKIFMRPTRTGQITKSGVLLDGSYYQISVTSDGFNTINLNLSDDPGFQAIEKRLVYRSIIYSSSAHVSEWCNSLSDIKSFMFAGQPLGGSFTFNNVSFVNQYAFAIPFLGGGASFAWSCTINFLRSSGTFFGQNAFQQNGMIREINAPYTSEIPGYFCYSCTNLTTLSFPECTNIKGSAFCSCGNLTTISFPKCTNIEYQAFYSCSKLTTISFPECISIGYQVFYNCSSLTTISFPECISIGGYAFTSCRNLTTISFPKCTNIDYGAFYSCSKLTTASFPECTSIGYQAFYSCISLTTISFPECTYLGSNAFYSCSNLTTALFPKCTSLGSGTFYNCSNLTTASFPECTFIGIRAFYGCSSLTTISFPKCTSIEYSAFQYCSNLTAASFPECTFIGSSAFQQCSNLTTISFPECTNIDAYAFYSCVSLTTISFPKCISIGMNAFYICKELESAYFMGSSIPSIGANIFQLTPMTSTSYLGYYGSIYVPSSLLASYKTATNWAVYSSRMVGI